MFVLDLQDTVHEGIDRGLKVKTKENSVSEKRKTVQLVSDTFT
jgi:hypothetical protein